MSTLKAHDFCGKNVVDSREVAAMVDKRHDHLLRDIDGYVDILENSGAPNFGVSDFFIRSTYVSEQNKELPCYLITKKGCDLIAHKLTGKKGVLFTAAYIEAFEDMQQALNAPRRIPEASASGVAQLIRITRRAMLDSGYTAQDVMSMIKHQYRTWNIPVPPSVQNPAQMNLFSPDYQQMLEGA